MAKKAYAGNEKNIRSVRFKQGTVSRDIRDLKLVKVAIPGGGYRYEEAQKQADSAISGQFQHLYRSSVVRVDQAQNLVVIHCYNGMASAVCASLDTQTWDGVIGTLAGDDTILVIMKTEKQAENLVRLLQEI